MNQLAENTPIGAYRVQRFIKEGLYNDSYVVVDEGGELFFLKRFDMAAVPDSLKTEGTVMEIMVSRKVQSPYVTMYVADGLMKDDGIEYPYLVTPFYQGTLLSDELRSGHAFTPQEARGIILSVIEGLIVFHEAGFSHNDITPRNILLETTGEGKVTPRIIDLGHACATVSSGTPPFPVKDLNVLYVAPEALKGVFGPSGDVFSAAAVFYAMLTCRAPWDCPVDQEKDYATRKRTVQVSRRAELQVPEGLEETDPALVAAIRAGLAPRNNRPSAKQLHDILLGKQEPASGSRRSRSHFDEDGSVAGPKEQDRDRGKDEMKVNVEVHRNIDGGGFSDVAGMNELKQMLLDRVIWVLSDKEKAAKYRISPPNGMLLYGPPGCGKTYFAQKFAEESKFNYMLVNGSDLGSVYIHGTQGKIASLFKEAQAKAPTVICFDEFDAFVPARGSRGSENKSEEVNEFLSQLNNCSQRGIFVIGTTNRIDIIDAAVLRKGRLDLHFEIPAPDLETREAMFKLHLRLRPVATDVDVSRLAALTDGYASSDIAFLVNEAAMVAALADTEISQQHLEDAIRCNPSSLGPRKEERRRIGYK